MLIIAVFEYKAVRKYGISAYQLTNCWGFNMQMKVFFASIQNR